MLKLQKAIVVPQLLYGCDDWTLIKGHGRWKETA